MVEGTPDVDLLARIAEAKERAKINEAKALRRPVSGDDPPPIDAYKNEGDRKHPKKRREVEDYGIGLQHEGE